ncbi:MAG TPA: ester cyclase [Pyrinomonadaceae bacterium]|nr:ester cyclase [Pyrinomonadaceae bacterium]
MRSSLFGAIVYNLGMTDANAGENVLRNKQYYLDAKAAFNSKEIDYCVSFYAADHQVKSKQSEKGREGIHAFFVGLHQTWPDIQITVEHCVAEDDWVMGRSVATATHSQIVLGVPPTGETITATFWDLQRFNEEGLIIETWNLLDSLAIMQQIGALK